MRTVPIAWMLLMLSSQAAAGTVQGPQPAEVAERTHDIVAEDYFSLAHIAQVVPSPDGRKVAWVELRWAPPEKTRNADLWVVDVATRERRRLTFDHASDTSPAWSPDSRSLYFLSARKRSGESRPPWDGKPQVWRVQADGTGLMAVTRERQGAGRFQLSADGRALYYTVTEEHIAQDGWQTLRKQFKKLKYGDGIETMSQIWRLDLQQWRAEKLVDDKRVIGDFDVARDGGRIAMKTTPSRKLIDNEGNSRIDIWDARTRKVTPLPDALWRAEAPSPYGWLMAPRWSEDGRLLAFRIDFDGYPGELLVASFDERGHRGTRRIARRWEITLEGDQLQWVPGSRDLCVLAESQALRRVYCVRALSEGEGRGGSQGETVIYTARETGDVGGFGIARGGAIAFALGDLTHPPDVFVARAPGTTYTRLTRVNPQVDRWKLPQIERVRWKSRDGTPVEGILELPPGYVKGSGPLPMVMEIHGGPTSSTHATFRFWIYGRTLFAARGWALLSPNYRGSTGYGDKFLTDLIGHKNDRDVDDLLSGVDAMIDRGLADPERLAVMGWSNGGYLTNCLITRDARFKAASSGAGVFDTTMQWMIEDTPGHVVNFNRGLPWTARDAMVRSAPLYNVDKVRTPTLIHVGEKDPRVPAAHSEALYRALRFYLKQVPTELIVYPGELHGLRTYEHRKAKMAWDIEWFDRHVLGRKGGGTSAAAPADPAVPRADVPASPPTP